MLVAATGALGLLGVDALGLEPDSQRSAVAGVAVGTLTGLLALGIKASLIGAASNGLRDLKVQLATMGASFGLRLLAIMASVFVLRRVGLPFEGFLLSFCACYLAQQVIEVRYVLRAALAPAPEVVR
jgi:hypothetical protein